MSNYFCLENRNFLKIALKHRNFSKICLKKSKFFTNLPEKNRNFSKICLKKIDISLKFAWKIEILLTRIHDPQISNQIEAAVLLDQIKTD